MFNAVALFGILAYASSDLWSVGIPVQIPASPLQIERVASRWSVQIDPTINRPTEVVYKDCVVLVNRSLSATITHAEIVFGAADHYGIPKRPNLTLDLRRTIKPAESLSDERGCLPRGYANGDRGLWLVGWVSEVDFADGTSWHAPPDEAVLVHIASAVREHGSRR